MSKAAVACSATATSTAVRGHEHACDDGCNGVDHWCRGCRRWFWVPVCDLCGGPHPPGHCLL